MNDRYRSPEKSTGENKGIFCAFLRDRGIEIGGIREMHHMTEADNPRFSRSARLVMFRETTLGSRLRQVVKKGNYDIMVIWIQKYIWN